MLISKKYTEDALKKFIKEVVSESKENLSTKGINASGDLSKSIKGNVNVGDNSIELTIEAQDYLKFIDKGVAGVKSGRSLAGYAYKSKGGKRGLKGMPPPSAFDKWNIRRGRAGRNELGQFLSRKQLNFKTAVGVFNYGIKPTEFFTKPFESAFERLPDDLVKAYALDLEDFIEFTLKD